MVEQRGIADVDNSKKFDTIKEKVQGIIDKKITDVFKNY